MLAWTVLPGRCTATVAPASTSPVSTTPAARSARVTTSSPVTLPKEMPGAWVSMVRFRVALAALRLPAPSVARATNA